jgi:hypothetical protein
MYFPDSRLPRELTHSCALPTIEESGCSAAFLAARDEVRQLRSFSPEVYTIMETLARYTLVPQSLPQTLPSILRAKDDEGQIIGLRAYRKQSLSSLSEKLASDIAWDLGLPHVTYGLIKGRVLNPRHTSFCVEPTREAKSLEQSFDKSLADLAFLKPHLAPGLTALAIFDIWLRVGDRHPGNLVLHASANGDHETLTGIDLECANYALSAKVMPWHGMVTMAAQIADTPSQHMAEQTLQAIANYPASRLNRLTKRLYPLARNREIALYLENAPNTLHHRRTTLRADAARLFPKLQLDRKVFAAPKLAA